MTHRKRDRPALAGAKAGFSTATAYRIRWRGSSRRRSRRCWRRARHPHLHSGVRRTIERRVRAWKAKHGPEQEIIFRQRHEPGRRGLSDFTDAMGLEVTVAGEPLAHKLVPLPAGVLGVSAMRRWCWAGKSYVALAGGLQDALWALGGVPKEHRTDSLSAAFPEPETGRAGGPDCALRGAAGGLRDGGGAATTGAWPTRTGRSRARTGT